jgi:hypothetical protein
MLPLNPAQTCHMAGLWPREARPGLHHLGICALMLVNATSFPNTEAVVAQIATRVNVRPRGDGSLDARGNKVTTADSELPEHVCGSQLSNPEVNIGLRLPPRFSHGRAGCISRPSAPSSE